MFIVTPPSCQDRSVPPISDRGAWVLPFHPSDPSVSRPSVLCVPLESLEVADSMRVVNTPGLQQLALSPQVSLAEVNPRRQKKSRGFLLDVGPSPEIRRPRTGALSKCPTACARCGLNLQSCGCRRQLGGGDGGYLKNGYWIAIGNCHRRPGGAEEGCSSNGVRPFEERKVSFRGANEI